MLIGTPPGKRPFVSAYDRSKPFGSNEERLVGEALMASQTPGDVLAEMTRPPLPQIVLFPPLYGYPDYAHRQATIDDILQEDRYTDNYRASFSGGEAGWQSSARFVNGPI